MTGLYIASKILSFPGAYIRGFWEQFTCKLLGLPVEIPGYLRIDEACGHVEHALPKKGFAAYLIATGPGFMNFNSGLFILYALMVYVGASLLCSAFPLVEDAMNLYDLLYRQKKGNIIGRIFAFIPTVITYAGAYLEKYCITFILVAAGVTAGFLF